MLGNFEKNSLISKLNEYGYVEIEGSVSVDVSTLIQQHKSREASKMQADIEHRLACISTGSFNGLVTVLKFDVEETTLQTWFHQAKLKPVKNLSGVWFGWISVDPAHASVLEVCPFGPKPLVCAYVIVC